MDYQQLLAPIHQFLHCKTPEAWLTEAKKPENLPLLLTDHLICELKAAQTAGLLIRRYATAGSETQALLAWLAPCEAFAFYHGPEPDFSALQRQITKSALPVAAGAWQSRLIERMTLLIKEELHHFHQVYEAMRARHIPYVKISAGRYARGLLGEVRTHEPLMLVDKLICGAYIEARSCERFAALAPFLESDLQKFYLSLLRSEARHYQDYLSLAQEVADGDIGDRVATLGAAEARLILTPDFGFRFHSGIPS